MVATAPKPVKPTEAAKRLRVAVRSLRGMIITTNQQNTYPKLQIDTGYANSARDAISYWNASEEIYRDDVAARVSAIRVAAQTRRVSTIEEAVVALEFSLRNHHSRLEHMWSYGYTVFDVVRKTKPTTQQETITTATMMKLIDEINALVQQFPTVEDMPQTPAENVLRAIVAVLRHANIEGIQTNDLKWKEVLGGKSQNAKPVEAEAVEITAIEVSAPF